MLRRGERMLQVGWKAVGEFLRHARRAKRKKLALLSRAVDESFKTVAASEVRIRVHREPPDRVVNDHLRGWLLTEDVSIG